MPTENRSSNTEQMVSIPRDWAENYAGLLEERCAYVRAEQVNALLAQPAAQHQGEPIRLTAVGELQEDGDGGLEVQWLLEGGTAELEHGMLLLVAENNELCCEDGSSEVYTHADVGEVDDLLAATSLEFGERMEALEKERDTLRAQLAELVSAVRSINRGTAHLVEVSGDDEPGYAQRKEWVEWILSLCDESSASAEPSATVERDQGIPGTSFQRLNMLASQGE